MEKVEIAAVDGARAEAYPHGAQVTSWKPASGEERLFLSGRSNFGPETAIRGGVPIIFPQFGAMGTLQKHGFARVLKWEKIRAGQTSAGQGEAQFRLTANERTRSTWNHAFSASFVVSVHNMALSLALSVLNEDSVPFQFTAALHTYLLVDDIGNSVVRGLEGATFRDAAAGGVEKRQDDAELRAIGELDRIYLAIAEPLEVRDAVRTTRITMRGFTDVVVWNPGAERGATLPDMDPGDWRRMLCVEAAAVGTPVQLAPGERWTGQQTLTAL
ncbi:MAG TPA: D-hexose-6-phosphate mutarotase [Gemmatimonadaceae bacterium]|nr:D-hexose-6-phosphate mutarotase [Gemmatimonadaceae bacterium]